MPVVECCEIVLEERMEVVKRVQVPRNSVMQAYRDGWRNKRENCERQECHRFTCENYGRKDCVHGGQRGIEELYSPTNSNIWFRDMVMDWGTAVEGVCCGNELSERSLWNN